VKLLHRINSGLADMNIFDTNATGAVGFSVTARTASTQEDEGEKERSSLIPRRPQPSCISRAAGLPVICEGLVTLEFLGEYSVVLSLSHFRSFLFPSPVFYPIEIQISHIPFAMTCKKRDGDAFRMKHFLLKTKFKNTVHKKISVILILLLFYF